MHVLPSFLPIALVLAINFTSSNALASWYKGDIAVQDPQVTTLSISTKLYANNEKDPPTSSLDDILKNDSHAQGAIQNILGGVALCYNVLSNLLLYPIFSLVLLLLSVGAILLAVFWITKIKNDKPISTACILFTLLYFLFYLDLFLVVYQKKEILLLFLELEKDLFLTIVAASIGYIVGKFFSSRFFEEKKLP